MNRIFNIIFVILVLADILVLQWFDSAEFRYFTKPAIVGSLIGLLFSRSFFVAGLKNSIMAALFFSLFGDLFLLFTDNGEFYFLLGLLSFLLAHACYILAFVYRGNINRARFPWTVLLVLAYAFLVYQYIADSLGDKEPYVVAYMIILVLLAIVALLRRSYVTKSSFRLVLAGALLFIVSDSLLAVNTFKSEFPYSGILIMVTYAAAQWLLVHGAMEQDRSEWT